MFYANSNIHPAEEYARRLATLREWAADADVEVVEGATDPEAWGPAGPHRRRCRSQVRRHRQRRAILREEASLEQIP